MHAKTKTKPRKFKEMKLVSKFSSLHSHGNIKYNKYIGSWKKCLRKSSQRGMKKIISNVCSVLFV